MRGASIVGIGHYLPELIVTTEKIAERLDIHAGRLVKAAGIKERRVVTDETSSYMGAEALREALADAHIQLEQIDCIIGASGVPQQAIPCTASLIQKELDASDTGIPCFDINSTCLSFVTAFEIAHTFIQSGKYERIAIVSTEISSVGINEKEIESAVLFGDGAAAVILAASETTKGILGSHMETYSEGSSYTEIKGGGTLIPPRKYEQYPIENFLFHMNGPAVFKLSFKKIESFMNQLYRHAKIDKHDIQMVIPHQASGAAMKIIRKKLGFKEENFMNIIENHGNMIAASIPLALYYAIRQKKIQRGDHVLMLGTSAGLSIGGVIFEY